MTRDELIAQAKADNPKPMFATVNDVQVELSDAEYDEAINNWADMRLEQLAADDAE